ncbi:MAG: PEP-CTERM sorting domain-containing protein [Desulfobaccales bacterium]
MANGPDSNWIGITANKTNNGPAPYSFQYTFNLSSFVLSTVSLSGSWTIDDEGTLSVNDHVISTLGNGNWVSLDNFSLAAGSGLLNQGLNTLDINMTSDDQYLEGGRLEGSITGTQVPEPCTMLLLGSGLAGLAGFRSRFKRS